MKKLSFILLSVALVLGFSSCHNEPDEPKAPAYVGDWYLNHAIVDFSLAAMGQDFSQKIDSTITGRSECFSLRPDSVVLVNGDSIGTYSYNELEGVLTVHTNLLSDMMGGEYAEMLPIDLSTMQFQANFTSDAAKIAYSQAASGTIMNIVPYSYDIQMQLYFER